MHASESSATPPARMTASQSDLAAAYAEATVAQLTSPLLRITTDPDFMLRSRVLVAVLHLSRMHAHLSDWWTFTLTSSLLGEVFERTPRTMSRLMDGLCARGYLERRRAKLPRGGWSWQYRAPDITEGVHPWA